MGLFDVHDFPEFKAYNNIKKLPIINLYLHKISVSYEGLLSETNILQWITNKV